MSYREKEIIEICDKKREIYRKGITVNHMHEHNKYI